MPLSLERVTFAYSGEAPVLDEASLTIEPGSYTLVRGASGAGKSTLLRLLCRLEEPQDGTIRFRDRDIREMAPAELRNLADTLRQKLGTGVVVLGMESGGKATLLAAVTDDLVDRVNAGAVVRELAPVVGGRGGGRPNLAQAGGPDAAKIDDALAAAPEVVERLVKG